MSNRKFADTEAGDAEYFAKEFGKRVRFDHRRGRWLRFAEHRWVPDTDGEMHRLAVSAMRLRQQDTFRLKDSKTRKRRYKWAIDGESRRRIENMLALAKTVTPISDAGNDWDCDPWLIGVRNGVVHLRSGRLRAGRPTDRITMSVKTSYEPAAKCPLWEQTICQLFGGERDLIEYIHRALGYSLTGMTNEQCLFMNWGSGANGKGTLMNTVAAVLGDYADDLPFSALELHARSGIPNDVAKLVNKRFVTSSETGDGVRLNEARIKAITGCDPLTARFLHREFFTFQPTAKFWLATNHKPDVRDDSYGFWRRMRLIPFTQQFCGVRDNKDLKDKLRAEAPGILRWLVDGSRAWDRCGLEPPQTVQDATSAYQIESDRLTAFFEESCELGTGQKIQSKHLYRAYEQWCAEREIERLNLKAFGQQVRKRFDAKEQHHIVTYFGVGLRQKDTDPLTHSDPSLGLSHKKTDIEEETDKRVSKGRGGQR
ncbi:MAG: phage/plasmid primase, P4 family, partial [Planctomycetota bacterium]|nr:phage/plasmid primase, P4 family [Planctomycetota bacterium]